jgi:hypothetical protein
MSFNSTRTVSGSCLPDGRQPCTVTQGRVEVKMGIDAPIQSWLITVIEDRPIKDRYEAAMLHIRKVSRDQGNDKTIKTHDVDILVALMDSPVCSLSTVSGMSLLTIIDPHPS